MCHPLLWVEEITSEGEMQEWLNWTVSKTVVAQVTVGSNPTLSVFSLMAGQNNCRKTFFITCGAVAQLGECIPRTDEVTGSNPVCSIRNCAIKAQFVLSLLYILRSGIGSKVVFIRCPISYRVQFDEMRLKILRRDAGVG